jgi:hypothetical protein
VALGLMDVRLRLQTQTRQNAGNGNPIMKSETAFMSEGKKAFLHSSGILAARDSYSGIYGIHGRFETMSEELGKKNSKKTDTLREIPLCVCQ